LVAVVSCLEHASVSDSLYFLIANQTDIVAHAAGMARNLYMDIARFIDFTLYNVH
jgi:hypothetical protein